MSKIIQSYVWYKNKCFFVSTVNRESSATSLYDPIYAETIVWDYDYELRECGSIIWQDEDAESGIYTHQWICEQLHNSGIIDYEIQKR